MKVIPLTKGCVAWIDDDDYEAVAQFHWHAQITSGIVYARRETGGKGQGRRIIPMQYEIVKPVPGLILDHVQHRPGVADNRRANLRLLTPKENNANRRKAPRKTSPFKGVSLVRKTGRWQVAIGHPVTAYLGHFRNEGHAALAYDLAAVKRYGAHAHTNSPVSGSIAWLCGEEA